MERIEIKYIKNETGSIDFIITGIKKRYELFKIIEEFLDKEKVE